MAKKKRKKSGQPVAAQQQPAERQVPKFEIGVKGDEFDVAYTRAAARESEKVSALMSGLSRESKKNGLNLLSFAVLSLLMLFMALSFAFLSRDASAPKLRPEKLADGSFLSELSEYYADSLPLGGVLKNLGAKLGFGDGSEEPVENPVEELPPEVPSEPIVTTTAAADPDPATTTTPAATAPPTTVSAETTELVIPETFRMYAQENVNIRLAPSLDSMIMGYFYTNERVDVIEIGDDGWASIWYNDMVAYVGADSLGESRVKITAATTQTEAEPTAPDEVTEEPTDETSDEVTTAPEETEPETTPEETSDFETTATPEPEPATTTTTGQFATPEEASAYYSRLASQYQATATSPEPTAPSTTTPPTTVTTPPATTPPETTPVTTPQPPEPSGAE